VATPNYSYEKRQKELAKKRKKEDKLKRKVEGKPDGDVSEDGVRGSGTADDAQPGMAPGGSAP
jgi:hypothetical protein